MCKLEGAQLRSGGSVGDLGFRSICPYGVSSSDLTVVLDVRETEREMERIAKSKVTFLEGEYKKISNKLIGFQFTMDDRRMTAKEDEEKVQQLQDQLDIASKAVKELELQANLFCCVLPEVCLGFRLDLRVSLAVANALGSLCAGHRSFEWVCRASRTTTEFEDQAKSSGFISEEVGSL